MSWSSLCLSSILRPDGDHLLRCRGVIGRRLLRRLAASSSTTRTLSLGIAAEVDLGAGTTSKVRVVYPPQQPEHGDHVWRTELLDVHDVELAAAEWDEFTARRSKRRKGSSKSSRRDSRAPRWYAAAQRWSSIILDGSWRGFDKTQWPADSLNSLAAKVAECNFLVRTLNEARCLQVAKSGNTPTTTHDSETLSTWTEGEIDHIAHQLMQEYQSLPQQIAKEAALKVSETAADKLQADLSNVMEEVKDDVTNPYTGKAWTPKNYKEAVKADNDERRKYLNHMWTHPQHSALAAECRGLAEKQVFEVVERKNLSPQQRKSIVHAFFIFKYKRHEDRAKARLVVNGAQYKQKGNPYLLNYSAVVSAATVRMMLRLTAWLRHRVISFDLAQAFVQIDVPKDDDYYIVVPDGYRHYAEDKLNGRTLDKRKYCLRLRKMLYGRRDSPRALWLWMTKHLATIGLKQSSHDIGFYHGMINGKLCMLCLHVDDAIVSVRSIQ